MDTIDKLEWWIFIRVMKIRKLQCPGWLGLSFQDEDIAWAHWVFSCQEDCPMRRNEKRRMASFKRFKKHNQKR